MGAAALVLATACGSDSSVSPSASAALSSATLTKDIATTAGNAVVSDLDAFAYNDVFAGIAANRGFLPIAPSLTENVSPSDSGSGSSADSEHVTPAGTPPAPDSTNTSCSDDQVHHDKRCHFFQGDNTVQSTVTFVDASGIVTNGFVQGVTDTIRTALSLVRHDTSGNGRRISVLYRNVNKAIGGFTVLVGDRTTNGTGTGADTTTFTDSSGATRTYASTSTDTITALVFAERRTTPYPKSGQIIFALDATATAFDGQETTTKTITRRIVVTFDGSATATMQVGTSTCQLHLDTRTVDNCQ